MAASRRACIAIVATVVVVVAAIGYHWAWPLYVLASMPVPEDRCPGHQRFDAAVWRDSTRVHSALAPRGCMVDDLLARYALRGMDRGTVVGLLGDPPQTSYFREYDLVYWLGPERGMMSIDSEWLVLRLDRTGRVAEARLLTD